MSNIVPFNREAIEERNRQRLLEHPYWPYEERPPADCFIGLDLGQEDDLTAFTMITPIGTDRPTYHLDYLERWRPKRYGDVVDRAADLIADATDRRHVINLTNGQYEYLTNRVHLVVDRTGVGRAVGDQFTDADLPCNLVLVTITGGQDVTNEGNHYKVPKKDLVAIVNVLLRAERLGIASDLPDSSVLRAELGSFRMTISKRGHASFAAGTASDTDWRRGEHDDLVLSASLGLWFAEQTLGHGRFEAVPESMRAALEEMGIA